MSTSKFTTTFARQVFTRHALLRPMATQAATGSGGGAAASSSAAGGGQQTSSAWNSRLAGGVVLGAAGVLLTAPALMFTPPTISQSEKGHCMHCPEELDEDDEDPKEQKPNDTAAKVLSSSVSEDDEDYLTIPSYVPEHFKEDLGGALNHNVRRLSKDAKFGLASEAVYPIQKAEVTLAPNVPPPIKRNHPVHLIVDMVTTNKLMNIVGSTKYEYWPFGYYDYIERKNKYGVPGPFIRARVGDVLQVNFTNLDESGMAHSIDFHAVCGPGGGSPTTFAEQDETKVGAYLLQKPGLYIYHCAAAPIPIHIHNSTSRTTRRASRGR